MCCEDISSGREREREKKRERELERVRERERERESGVEIYTIECILYLCQCVCLPICIMWFHEDVRDKDRLRRSPSLLSPFTAYTLRGRAVHSASHDSSVTLK